MLRSNFLFFGSADGNNIRSAAERLVAAHENDLETYIYDEFVQFQKLLKTDWENRLSNDTNLLSPSSYE